LGGGGTQTEGLVFRTGLLKSLARKSINFKGRSSYFGLQ